MKITLDIPELRALISGNFTFRKCLECDGRGWNWYCLATGEEIAAPIDEYSSKECCDSCQGLGGFLNINT